MDKETLNASPRTDVFPSLSDATDTLIVRMDKTRRDVGQSAEKDRKDKSFSAPDKAVVCP